MQIMSGTNNPNKVEAIKQIGSLINQIDQIKKVVRVVRKVSNSTTFGDKMTADQACEYLETNEETFNRWVMHGFITPDKQHLFKRSDIENLKRKITK